MRANVRIDQGVSKGYGEPERRDVDEEEELTGAPLLTPKLEAIYSPSENDRGTFSRLSHDCYVYARQLVQGVRDVGTSINKLRSL